MTDTIIILGGERVALRCTPRIAMTVNAIFGSYTAAFRKLAEYDLSAYVSIVATAQGRPMKEVEADVYAVGMTDLMAPLTTYLNLLANGGRPPAESPASGEG